MEENGPFELDENDLLSEQDFLRLYDLIESVGRFELNQLREFNEKSREMIFKEAFIDNQEDQEFYKQYIM